MLLKLWRSFTRKRIFKLPLSFFSFPTFYKWDCGGIKAFNYCFKLREGCVRVVEYIIVLLKEAKNISFIEAIKNNLHHTWVTSTLTLLLDLLISTNQAVFINHVDSFLVISDSVHTKF